MSKPLTLPSAHSSLGSTAKGGTHSWRLLASQSPTRTAKHRISQSCRATYPQPKAGQSMAGLGVRILRATVAGTGEAHYRPAETWMFEVSGQTLRCPVPLRVCSHGLNTALQHLFPCSSTRSRGRGSSMGRHL